MSTPDWTDRENDAIVADYFAMLADELSGRTYSKAAHNRDLQGRLGRSRGSIEFKYANVFAALKAFGQPVLKGYRPRVNFQESLLDAVARWLDTTPEWTARLPAPEGLHDPAAVYVGTAPTLRNTPPPDELDLMLRVARKYDIAARDERNRALGRAGEALVIKREKMILRAHGVPALADQVRWISEEDDGAGYDIASFTPDGAPRLLEVKTTNGWDRTPFFISRNELAVADARRAHWRLFRLHDFASSPGAFELTPPLEAHVTLTAQSYEASFD